MAGRFTLRIFIALLLCASFRHVEAQVYCPTNINLESGTLTNWSFDTAINGGLSGIISVNSVSPIAGRHSLTNGIATDYYGAFPIVDPVGGSYSLKVGNDQTGAQVDRARYTITVPANINNYSLIYRYAVVLENPAHANLEQPYFKVRVYNAATNATVNCASFTYVSSSVLPGFTISPNKGNHANPAIVYYKPWATGSLNLSGQAGNTLVVEFTSADCSLRGHMGYGYVDMSCGLFAISSSTCNPTSPLTAPPGFQSYTWYNSNYSAIIGTGQSITVTTPTLLTQYHVVLTPYTGYGCPDTLHTQVIGSSLAMNAGPDTMLCNNSSVTLNPVVTGNGAPYSYIWTPGSGLSCTSCLNPVASPAVNTNYVLSVTDSFGCTRRDTILVKARPVVSTTMTNVACFGNNTGAATASVSQGTAPYTFSWNTSPAQITASAGNLSAGSYTVTVSDAKGCLASQAVAITQPTSLVAALASSDSVSCNGAADGKLRGTGSGGTGTIRYSWNTNPIQNTATATALSAGSYVLTITDSLGCVDTELVRLAQPQPLIATLAITHVSCNAGANGAVVITAVGGTPPYVYAIDAGAFASSATLPNLAAGPHIVHLKDAHGCLKDTGLIILQPARLSANITPTRPSCFADSNGSVTITANGGTSPYRYAIGTGNFGTAAIFNALKAGTQLLHILDTAGCALDTSVVIAQPAALGISAVVTPVLCKGGSTGSITIGGSGATPAYTYAIDNSAFGTVAGFTALPAGMHTIRLKDANGCSRDSLLSVTEPAALTMTFTATAPLCNGAANGSIAILSSGGVSPYLYALNTGAFGVSGNFSGLQTGTHVLHLRDANGCTKDSTIQLTQPSAPLVTVTTTAVVCNGANTGGAQAAASGGTQPYTYSWTGTNATTPSITGLVAGSYTVTVLDSKGCSVSATASVSQPAAITILTSATPPLCNGASNGTAAANASGGTAPYSYAWSTSPAQTAATATALSSGTYTVSVTDGAGCPASKAISVPVTAPVIVSVASYPVTCNGGRDGVAIANATNGNLPYAYQWATSPVQRGDTARGLGAGSYAVTATSADGCVGTVSVAVTEPSDLRADVASRNTCPGFRQGRLTAGAYGGNGSYSYTWNTRPVQTGVTASGLDTGIFTVVITDAKGCKDSVTASVGVFTAPAITATAASDTGCRGIPNELRAFGADSYLWSPAGSLSCAACQSPLANPAFDTTYTVIGTDANGCMDTASVRVHVMQRVALAVGPQQKICEGDSVRLRVAGGQAWQWFPSSLTGGSRDTTITVRPSQSTVFRVVVRENRCFTDTLEQYVDVLPTPVVDLGPDLNGLIGSVIELKAAVAYAGRIEWKPATGLSCGDCYTPKLTVRGKVRYVATVYNELGCTASDSIAITDVCDEHYFYFANMFTPNGDGSNDRFYPQGAGSSIVQHFMIYDRWGEIVFSASNIAVNDPLAGWDGTFRNQQLKPDVYVYVMDAVCETGNKIVVRGDVTLVR